SLRKLGNVGPADSIQPVSQRCSARTDFVISKTSVSRRSGPGSATPFKGSRPDTLVFMLSTLRTSQTARKAKSSEWPRKTCSARKYCDTFLWREESITHWLKGDLCPTISIPSLRKKIR